MIENRLSWLPVDQKKSIINFIELYNLEININNFVDSGIIFHDLSQRTVAPIFSKIKDNVVELSIKPFTDITVISINDGMFIGWIRSDKINISDQEFSIGLKSLSPMPNEFNFAQICAHMSEWGGWFIDGNWECAGCGQQIVIN